MTPQEYRAALESLGLSQQAAGRWLGVSPKTAQNYATVGPSGPAARAVLMALKLSPKAWAAELASAGALPPGGRGGDQAVTDTEGRMMDRPMECSFVTTREQAERLAQSRLVIEFRMKRESYDALGLGCGLWDAQEAVIDLGGGPMRHWLLSAVPGADGAMLTRWTPAKP